jgi:uncharacterized repeat protein (TIGR04138 family)
MLDPDHPIVELLRRDRRFRLDAYVFIFEALRFAQQELAAGPAPPGDADGPAGEAGGEEIRHVTGQQLCEAIRRYALQQYGALAIKVLDHWGIHSTGDFGEIVFNLIEIGQMNKTDSDRREDFEDVFDFEEGLREPFAASASETRKERRP